MQQEYILSKHCGSSKVCSFMRTIYTGTSNKLIVMSTPVCCLPLLGFPMLTLLIGTKLGESSDTSHHESYSTVRKNSMSQLIILSWCETVSFNRNTKELNVLSESLIDPSAAQSEVISSIQKTGWFQRGTTERGAIINKQLCSHTNVSHICELEVLRKSVCQCQNFK